MEIVIDEHAIRCCAAHRLIVDEMRPLIVAALKLPTTWNASGSGW